MYKIQKSIRKQPSPRCTDAQLSLGGSVHKTDFISKNKPRIALTGRRVDMVTTDIPVRQEGVTSKVSKEMS